MSQSTGSLGPLSGVKVIEIESIGPGPFCAMLLADLGANVLTVGRDGPIDPNAGIPVITRGRAGRLALNLKSDEGKARVLGLASQADVLIEGFRPGVMERLGLGPDEALKANPKLIYGRMTGWGQEGPWAQMAGHDINYISLSGALHAMGTKNSGPVPPLNLVGDFGGGGMMLALGIVSALFEARSSGKGQVIDACMVEGASVLMGMIYGLRAKGIWPAERAGNFLDGSAYFYRCYETSDGKWMAVGSIEPQFRAILFEKLGLGEQARELMKRAHDDADLTQQIEAIFASKDRDHWCSVFDGTDACVSPVLSMEEAPGHSHNQARGSFFSVDGATHPVRSPGFSRTSLPEPSADEDRSELMKDWGL